MSKFQIKIVLYVFYNTGPLIKIETKNLRNQNLTSISKKKIRYYSSDNMKLKKVKKEGKKRLLFPDTRYHKGRT